MAHWEYNMKISNRERQELMRLMEDPATAVGIQIPGSIIWNGKEIKLRNEIWELTHDESEGERRKKELLEILNNLINEKIERIRTGDITMEEGEHLVEECVGLERAVDDLQNRNRDIEEDMKNREIKDHKRWLKFIKRVKQ